MIALEYGIMYWSEFLCLDETSCFTVFKAFIISFFNSDGPIVILECRCLVYLLINKEKSKKKKHYLNVFKEADAFSIECGYALGVLEKCNVNINVKRKYSVEEKRT